MLPFPLHTDKPLRLLLVCWLLVLAVYAPTANAQPLRIGVMAPLTGKLAAEGEDARRVLTLLAEQWNASGALGDNTLVLEFQDDAGDPRTAALAAQKLLAQGALAIISAYGSSVTEAAQQLINEAGLPHFSSGATSVRLTEKKLPNFFRMGPRDDAQSRKAVDYLVRQNIRTLAIVHDNTSHPRGFAEEVRDTIDALPPQNAPRIVFFDALPPGQRDYSAVLQKIRQVQPELLLYTGYYPETALLLRQKAEMQWPVPMLGGDASNHQDLVSMAGVNTAQDYMFLSAPMPQYLTSPEAQIFLQAYTSRHGQPPLSVWSALTGDGLNCIAQALSLYLHHHPNANQQSPENAAALSTAIAAYAHSLAGQPHAGQPAGPDPSPYPSPTADPYLGPYPSPYLGPTAGPYLGLTGPVAFDAKGDRIGDLYMLYRVDAGKFVPKNLPD